MSISIFRNTRFKLAFSLELSFSLKTSGNCSNGSWKKKIPKRVCFKGIRRTQTIISKPLISKLHCDSLAEKLRYTSRVQHIRSNDQTLNEVEIVLFTGKRTNSIGLKFHKKWRQLHKKLKNARVKRTISNLTCLFLDLIFALSRAISRHNARVWDKLQCCSACNKMA